MSNFKELAKALDEAPPAPLPLILYVPESMAETYGVSTRDTMEVRVIVGVPDEQL